MWVPWSSEADAPLCQPHSCPHPPEYTCGLPSLRPSRAMALLWPSPAFMCSLPVRTALRNSSAWLLPAELYVVSALTGYSRSMLAPDCSARVQPSQWRLLRVFGPKGKVEGTAPRFRIRCLIPEGPTVRAISRTCASHGVFSSPLGNNHSEKKPFHEQGGHPMRRK